MKKVLIGLGVVVLGYLVLCLFGSKEVNIERNVVMDHPADSVYQEIVSFENWEHWSPWLQMDSNVVITYSGTEGVGSSASWSIDNEMVGKGKQTIIEVVPGEYVVVELEFEGQGSAEAYFKINAMDDSTSDVKWGFHMETPFLARGFMQFIDFEKELGPMYETGLNSIDYYLDEEVKSQMAAAKKRETEHGISSVESISAQKLIEEPTQIKPVDTSTELFINGDVGVILADAIDNDLTSRAFDHVVLEKESGGDCEEQDLGNDVMVLNDHESRFIKMRMSIVWKNEAKEKITNYKEYELAPMERINVGCTEVAAGKNNKVRWNIIHTVYADR